MSSEAEYYDQAFAHTEDGCLPTFGAIMTAKNELQKEVKPILALREALEARKGELAKALPRHLTADRLIRVTMTAVQRSPQLLKCSLASIYAATLEAAQLGLETDGVLGHAYLVPYQTTCQLIIGYKGLIQLARNSGDISWIAAHVVYEADEFDFAYGLEPVLVHKPARGVRGKPIAAYAAAKFKDGGSAFEVMWVEEINRIRDSSPGSKRSDSPWQTDWDEMARKTPLRRLAKYLPLSVEAQTAVSRTDAIERGYSPDGARTVEVEPMPLPALEAREDLEAHAAETLDGVLPGGLFPEVYVNGKCQECGAKSTKVGERETAIHLRGCPTQPTPTARTAEAEG